MAARFQLRDDFIQPLQMIAMRDEHGVGRVDDEQSIDTDGRDDAVRGVHIGVARGDRRELTLAAIAHCVGFDKACHGGPGANVAPAELTPHHGHLRCMLHNGDVE